jgi:hypothetical protein
MASQLPCPLIKCNPGPSGDQDVGRDVGLKSSQFGRVCLAHGYPLAGK